MLRRATPRCLNEAQKVSKAPSRHLFTDVYDEMPWHLREQEQAVTEHIQKYAADGRYAEYLQGNEHAVVDRLGRA